MVLYNLYYSDRISSDVDDNRKKKEQNFWNRVAKIYDQWIESDYKDQYIVFRSKISSVVQSDDVVLEIGTGTGDIAFHMATKCKEVVGIDISPEMIEIAKAKNIELNLKNLTFQVGDAYNLSFIEATFNKVVCCNALQTMKEPIRAISEGKRVLKSNGEFVSITYCFGDSALFERLRLLKWIFIYGMPKYWINFKRKDLIANFRKAGLEIIEKEDIWENPVVLYLRCIKV